MPPPPSHPEAARLEAEGQILALIPFLGIVKKGVGEPVMNKHFTGKPEFEQKLHIIEDHDCTTYSALARLVISCNHCKKKVSTVTVDKNVPKGFNQTICVDHLAECHSIDDDSLHWLCCVSGCRSAKVQKAGEKLNNKRALAALSVSSSSSAAARDSEAMDKSVKEAKTSTPALKNNDERQTQLNRFFEIDTGCTEQQFLTGMWFLGVFFFMCRIPFMVADNIWFRMVCYNPSHPPLFGIFGTLASCHQFNDCNPFSPSSVWHFWHPCPCNVSPIQ
jgi:hypothetical protein